MPIYEYKCDKGHTFEREQKMTAKPLRACPVDTHAGSNCCAIGSCNAPVKRLISKTSFILKGKGWYKDGY